jgi:hypothetical protein
MRGGHEHVIREVQQISSLEHSFLYDLFKDFLWPLLAFPIAGYTVWMTRNSDINSNLDKAMMDIETEINIAIGRSQKNIFNLMQLLEFLPDIAGSDNFSDFKLDNKNINYVYDLSLKQKLFDTYISAQQLGDDILSLRENYSQIKNIQISEVLKSQIDPMLMNRVGDISRGYFNHNILILISGSLDMINSCMDSLALLQHYGHNYKPIIYRRFLFSPIWRDKMPENIQEEVYVVEYKNVKNLFIEENGKKIWSSNEDQIIKKLEEIDKVKKLMFCDDFKKLRKKSS